MPAAAEAVVAVVGAGLVADAEAVVLAVAAAVILAAAHTARSGNREAMVDIVATGARAGIIAPHLTMGEALEIYSAGNTDQCGKVLILQGCRAGLKQAPVI
jgi:hypothetical protein